MKKNEKLIRYIIVTFIILCALGAFSNNQIISGIMLIISGIVLLPYIDEKMQFKSKKIIEIIISVVLFFQQPLFHQHLILKMEIKLMIHQIPIVL